jgi:probable HAF family extracellular repeat protein
MSISMKKFVTSMLTRAGACALAATLAACGGGSHHGGHPPPPPPPAGLTYDVIPLSLGGTGINGLVGRQGINSKGQVAGSIDAADGRLHAFLYDGERTIDLGLLNGVASEASAINELGQVTGWVILNHEDGSAQAFLYDGTMHGLGTLGGREAYGLDINNSTQVVGYSTGTDNIRRAFLYQNGGMSPLPAPGPRSFGSVINDSGTAAGRYDDPNGFVRGFIVGPCRCPKDLGTLGGNQTFVFAINNAGQLAGMSESTSGRFHVFRYENGVIADVGTLGGDFASFGGMNESGWITGYSLTSTGQTRAFLHDGTTIRDLGTLGGPSSEGTSINASGRVVGWATTASAVQHAMTWTQADGMVDLNKVLHNPPAGLVLINAFAVADNGWIVAQGNPGLVLLKPRKPQ